MLDSGRTDVGQVVKGAIQVAAMTDHRQTCLSGRSLQPPVMDGTCSGDCQGHAAQRSKGLRSRIDELQTKSTTKLYFIGFVAGHGAASKSLELSTVIS